MADVSSIESNLGQGHNVMDWMPVLFLLYIGCRGNTSYVLNECDRCACCKDKRCENYGHRESCTDGCIDGYYGEGCTLACIKNCLKCSNFTSCEKCKEGYFGHTCEKCPSNCVACVSMDNCNTCKNGYYNGKQNGYLWETSFNDCRFKCYNMCNACTSLDTCTSCKDGFYNGYKGSYSVSRYSDCRYKCPGNCKSCTSYDLCTECNDGKYDGKSGKLCQNNCEPGCKDYQCDKVTGFCDCRSGFEGNKCDMCVAGLYGTNCDIQCPLGCATNICSRSGDCHDCRLGFTGKTCDECELGKYGEHCNISCSAGCAHNNCSKNGVCSNGCKNGFFGTYCDTCIDRRYGNSCEFDCLQNCKNCETGSDCSQCDQRYWGSNCLKCPPNCLNCTSAIECLSCDPGYFGQVCDSHCPKTCKDGVCNKINGACLSCTSNFHGNFCDKACPINCEGEVCNLSGGCLSCKLGYHGQTCSSKCPSNCTECNMSNGSCKTCVVGYYGHSCKYPCPVYCKAGSACTKLDGYCSDCADGYYYRRRSGCYNVCDKVCKTCVNTFWKCTECKDGKYGPGFRNTPSYPSCNWNCPKKCFNVTCDAMSGSCNFGCVSGFWGLKCNNPCPSTCKNDECHDVNGTCVFGCKDGYTGPYCKCPIDCVCDANGLCEKCENGYLNRAKNCTCKTDLCIDTACTRCSNSSYFAFRSSCCQCSSRCINNECESENKCSNGCVDGYFLDDCSGYCKDIDNYCVRCKQDSNIYIHAKCLTCAYGYYPHHTTNKCQACPNNCVGANCNPDNGKCMKGCKDEHWDEHCDENCDVNCLRCRQIDGECLVCKDAKYSKYCSKECSTNCSSTDGVILCAVKDGACLNGCDTLTKYGKHCDKSCERNCLNHTCNWNSGKCLNGCVVSFFGEYCDKKCSNNCEKDRRGKICNDLNGHCIVGCKVGYHGNTCENKCSDNCVNKTCERDTGVCSFGCKKGYTTLTCTLAQALSDTDATTVAVGAVVGASVFALVLLAVIVVIIVIKKRRMDYKDETADAIGTSNNLTVTNNEVLTCSTEVDSGSTEPVYAMPNKLRKRKTELFPLKELTPTLAKGNTSNEKSSCENAAVYENAPVRESKISSATETPQDIFDSVIEETEHNDSMTEPKQLRAIIDSDTYYNVTAVIERRIRVEKLAEFVSKKTKEDFEEEFARLPIGLIKTYSESQKTENAPKNRYKGIYPYDDTRVVLNGGNSDYINASYIDGYNRRRAYIASIGPTYKYMGDMSDFWRMIWQEKVGKIVMLTKVSEANVPKCDQYWPDQDITQIYANIEVSCQSEDTFADYTVRSFVAKKGPERRTIAHVQFTAWPDKGIPDDVTSLIEFRQKISSIKTDLEGPLLVHCSAGIGRTGTYIALDSLSVEGEVNRRVDIYACVRNLREQRVNMVQTAEQYQFLHNAVLHTLTFGSSAVGATNFNEYTVSRTDDHFEETFRKLQAIVECRPEEEIEAVKTNETITDKNREGADIPGNHNRPRLHLFRGSTSSDYINAVYVNSFRTVDRYLVAQTPLPNTVDDFLALIVQEKVSCIIDMEPNVTRAKSVGKYYPPENKTLKTGLFTVKMEPGERKDEYVLGKLTISYPDKKAEKVTVNHVRFSRWDAKKKVPVEPAHFIQFIKDIEIKSCTVEDKGPVLVHCLTGAERSGLFCVVSNLLEKTQAGQDISVVNTVRQIKFRRHLSIPSIVRV